jgi:PAS domain-containing protein
MQQVGRSLQAVEDWILTCIVKPVKSRSILELSLFQAVQDEYYTRHLLDGQIVNADQRISVVAGYTVSEVLGHTGFSYVLDEDKALTAILHKESESFT